MKRLVCMLVLCMCVGFLCACGSAEPMVTTGVPEETTAPTEAVTTEETTVPAAVLELDMSELTVTTIGEQVSIYSGEIPAEVIYWYSADSSVAAVELGVVTAMGEGIANVYGIYGDQKVCCTVTSSATHNNDKKAILTPPAFENADPSFFDDAVFVGDSISVKLSYCAGDRLGNAQFVVITSYGLHNAVNRLMSVPYRGGQYSNLEDAVAATGAKKVFIMLGVNDIGRFGLEQNMDNWRILVERIREACPGIQIYIQSMFPIWSGAQTSKLNNTKVYAYNFALRFFAEQYECGFIDVYPYLQNGAGGLAAEYCSDKYVHITEKGVDVWVSVLRAYPYYKEIEESAHGN